jgi:RNA polymerase sigma factor (sigma-70 family)
MENEADLIRQILLGRSELFEPIILEYQNLVFTVCLNIVRNKYDAENMAQETFLTAYSSLADFRGGNFKAWLCRIAVNKSIDCKRRQERLVLAGFDETAGLSGSEASVEETVAETWERKERREKLKQILAALPDKYGSVIKAFYYGRLPVKEIARRMELPERTVETRLYRAKKMIRERWGENGS